MQLNSDQCRTRVKRSPGRRATDDLLAKTMLLGIAFGIVMFALGWYTATVASHEQQKRNLAVAEGK